MHEYKTCTKCGQEKPFSDFAKHKDCKNGLNSQCKVCKKTYRAEWAKRNPEKVKAASDKYHSKNPELRSKWNREWRLLNSDYRSNYLAEYRKANSAKIRQLSQARWAANRDLYRKNLLEYQKAHPEIYRNNSAKRRARSKSNYRVTQFEIKKLLAMPCAYCGGQSDHIDHIVPISRGGEHRIGNLTGACAPCNLSKGSKFVTEWRKGKHGCK